MHSEYIRNTCKLIQLAHFKAKTLHEKVGGQGLENGLLSYYVTFQLLRKTWVNNVKGVLV